MNTEHTNFIGNLAKSNSVDYKLHILKNLPIHHQQILKYAYSPFEVYGVTFEIPSMDRKVGTPLYNVQLDEQFVACLHNCIIAIKTTNSIADKHALIAHHAKALSPEDIIVIKCIINKDLRCNIGAGLINKALPKLLPVFKIQKATAVPVSNIRFPIWSNMKFDGVRLLAFVHETQGIIFRTSSGKLMHSPKLAAAVIKYAAQLDTSELFDYMDADADTSFVLDGELVVGAGKTTDRSSISGMCNSMMKGGADVGDELVYHVFDFIPCTNDFGEQECDMRYEDRLEIITGPNRVSPIAVGNVRTAPSCCVHSKESLLEEFDDVIARGFEGLILKKPEHFYSFKRSKDWIKMKAVDTLDLLCTGTYLGKVGTKYEDCIGGLHLASTEGPHDIKVNVGSGLSDTQRLAPESDYVGKIIEVKYNTVIPAYEGVGYTLFLPRFVRIRDDK